MAPYQRMEVWDAHSSAKIDFDARMLAQDRLGVMLLESHLKQALFAQIIARNIPILSKWRCKKIENRPNSIVLHSEQSSCEARFLLIADGARSSVRDLLQIPMTTWPYHQHALVATVAVEKPHQLVAYQVFCERGPLAFLPMVDAHHCSIVWSSEVSHIQQLMTSSESSFLEALAQAFEYKLGAIKLLTARKSYPLQMQHVQQYVGEHWAIMGDAAHTIHPLAGLGLNLGLADLTAFIALMDKSSSEKRLSSLSLRAYHRQRKYELWQTILFLQAIHGVFTNKTLPGKLLRRVGLSVCDRLPMLKRLFIEQASGVTRT
jgi:2-octaprenylphenol hydroxylase